MILGGAEHAASREQVQQVDLQRLYQEVNHDSFAGSLPNVPVRWSDLTKDDAYGVTHFDKGVPYAIEVDRQSVKTESFALDVLRHESCHIATIGEAKRRNEDRQGRCLWSACREFRTTIKRIEEFARFCARQTCVDSLQRRRYNDQP